MRPRGADGPGLLDEGRDAGADDDAEEKQRDDSSCAWRTQQGSWRAVARHIREALILSKEEEAVRVQRRQALGAGAVCE